LFVVALMKKTIMISLLLGSSLAADADVVLPKVITSNMVIQRGQPISIWGTADAGEKVKVNLSGVSATTQASADGDWNVTLPKRGLSNALTLTVKGNNEIKLENILMGDVWLCSGQSNMEMGMLQTEKGEEAVAAAKKRTLRIFNVRKSKSQKLLKDIAKGSGWKVGTPKNLKTTGSVTAFGKNQGFSATAYYFGMHLQKSLQNVPIGLIESSWGGTRIEPWSSKPGVASVPELKGKDHPKGKVAEFYNSMIHGLAPMAIKGAIWYQGESNRRDGMLYAYRMRGLINGWRMNWGEDMPFYFVQLAPFSYKRDKAVFLPEIWEAQSVADSEILHTGMAVTLDIGSFNNIHPKNKKDVGKRLALLALKDTYGKDVVAVSPTATIAKSQKGGAIVTFKDVGGGLVVTDGQALREFEVSAESGKDATFKPAEAKVTGKNSVYVFNKGIAKPGQVRYAWKNTPKVNLANREGLPVPSFRVNVTP